MKKTLLKAFVSHSLILSCFLLFTIYSSLDAASWPLFRANETRTGSLNEQAEPKLTPMWHFTIQGQFLSSPVVYKDTLFIGGRDGSMRAFNAYTGAPIWDYSADDWFDATPYVSSSTVYAPCIDKYVYAFNSQTGEIRWKTYTGSNDLSSPVLYNGYLYFISGNPEKKVYKINSTNGQIADEYDISQFGFSSPAIKDNLLYFGTNDGNFHCIDLTSGQIIWSKQTKGGIFYSTLAVDDSFVYAVSGGDERKLLVLNPSSSGSVVWESVQLDNKPASVSSAALSSDKVFVAVSSGAALNLHAFNKSGTTPQNPLWTLNIGGVHQSDIISSPAIVNDVLYIGSGNGYLYSIDITSGQYIEPETGALTGTPTGYYLCYQLSPSTGIISSPCVSNGWVYSATFDGNFWAFQAEKIASIYSPDTLEKVVSQKYIEGSAVNPSLTDYKLEYGPGESPSSWTEILTSTSEVNAGNLGYWNASGLNDGTYSLRLTVNDGSTDERAINKIVIDNPPEPPTDISASDHPFDGGGSIDITWTKSLDDGGYDSDVTGYKIYRSLSNGNYSYLNSVTNSVSKYTDTTAVLNTTFYYTVTSFDASSESAYSDASFSQSYIDGVEIDPALGGSVELNYNGTVTEVVIPPGGLSQRAWIGIKIPVDYSETGIPSFVKKTSIVREFGITPADTKFLKNAIIKIPYIDSETSGMKQENLRIYWFDEIKNEWRIVNTSDPNVEGGRVWASVPHFSYYRIMEYRPGHEDLLSPDKVYTYPNPAKQVDNLSFKFYLGDKADVTIDVYNVAGEIIKRLEKSNCPAGITSEIEWDISRIASGVYVYYLKAVSESKDASLKKKLAIIK